MRKALILAAEPRFYQGPWIVIEEGSWRTEALVDYEGHVKLEFDNGRDPVFVHEETEVHLENPMRVRGVIRKTIEDTDISRISLQLCRV